MSGYLEILRTPGVARLIAAQLTARMPGGMLSLSLLIHTEQRFGTYASAGLVLAATSIGQAVSGPLTSRWMGAWGMRRVISLTIAVCAVALTVLAIVPLPLPAMMAIALVSGLAYPPIQPAVRTIYPKLVNSRQLTPLFSLDASAQELIWVSGPVIATFLATQVSPVAALLLCVACLVGGGVWFVASPEVGRVRIPPSRRRLGAVLTRPTVVLATVTGFLLVASFAAVEAGVVATFGEGGAESGIVLAIWSIGSLIGGLLLGNVGISPWSLARRMLVVLIGTAAAMAILDFWWLSIALLVSGLGIAPALAVMFASVSATVKFSETAEAYGWVGTGQLIGAAIGSAVAGFMIDGMDAIGGFLAATAFGVLGTAVAAIFHRHQPDLRGRDASPIADTEPVPTQPS